MKKMTPLLHRNKTSSLNTTIMKLLTQNAKIQKSVELIHPFSSDKLCLCQKHMRRNSDTLTPSGGSASS